MDQTTGRMSSAMRVAIVGSGLSGLSAAYYLPRDFKVTMFERDAKAGGRARTSSSFGGEEGAEFLLRSETAIHALLKRLGIHCYRIRGLVGIRFRGRYACGSFRTVAQQLLPRRSAKAVKSLLTLTPHYSKYSTAPADGWLRKRLCGDREAMAFLQMILAGETCAPLNHVGVRYLLSCLCSDSWYRIRGGSGCLVKTLRAKCRAKGRMTLKLRAT
jgi:predicted NAD/FAD-binding protein